MMTQKPQALKLLNQNNDVYVWKLTANSNPTNGLVTLTEYDEIGVVGFDFDHFCQDNLLKSNTSYHFPYLKLLMHLWPGRRLESQLMQWRRAKIDIKNEFSTLKLPKVWYWIYILLTFLGTSVN